MRRKLSPSARAICATVSPVVSRSRMRNRRSAVARRGATRGARSGGGRAGTAVSRRRDFLEGSAMGRFRVGGVDDRRWHDNALASRVRNLIDGALDWLVENLDLFDPFKDNHTFDQYYAKPLLELSMTCMLYSRHKNLNQDPRIGQIALFISRVWDRPEYWQRLTRFPEMLLLYGMTSIALRRCGFGNHCYPELMQRVLKQGYASAVEVVPYRALDFRYMLDCGGCEHTFASYSDIYKNTLLSKTPSVAYLTDEDAYAITHTLFYISDFGARPPDVIPPEQLPAVQRLTTSLLGVYLRSCNWDLVAEILVSCRCLNWRPNCLFEAAWSGLLGAQLANGAVPGPYFCLLAVWSGLRPPNPCRKGGLAPAGMFLGSAGKGRFFVPA
jgi:hypothetical protein